MLTYIGNLDKFAAHGCTFYRGQPRPVSDEVAAALVGHPWFVADETAAPVIEETPPRRRGRPRKADLNADE